MEGELKYFSDYHYFGFLRFIVGQSEPLGCRPSAPH